MYNNSTHLGFCRDQLQHCADKMIPEDSASKTFFFGWGDEATGLTEDLYTFESSPEPNTRSVGFPTAYFTIVILESGILCIAADVAYMIALILERFELS